jgi:hypothetical protein
MLYDALSKFGFLCMFMPDFGREIHSEEELSKAQR